MRHVLNDGPIRLALLLVGDGLLCQQRIIACWLRCLGRLRVFRLYALIGGALLLDGVLLDCLYPLGILAVSGRGDEDALGAP